MKFLFKQLIGIIFLTVGLVILVNVEMGASPFDTVNIFLSDYTILTFAAASFCVHLILAIITYIFRKDYFTRKEVFISVVSVFIITSLISVFQFLIGDLIPESYLFLIIGTLIFTYGISVIVYFDYIITPCDKFVILLARRGNRNYGYYKVIFDFSLTILVLVASLTWHTGNYITWFTIFIALVTGNFVTFFNKNINSKIFKEN